jgi:hypothetical protein
MILTRKTVWLFIDKFPPSSWMIKISNYISLLNLLINNYKLDLLLNLSCQLTEGNKNSI